MTTEMKRKSKWDLPKTEEEEPGDQGSSLEAASAAAAKINAMLIAKGKLKLPPAVVSSAQQAPKQKVPKTKEEPIIAEVEINDVPLQCRNLLTRGSTQEEISKMSGAAVSTRGRFMSYADRAKNNMGERPLYLCVQGLTKDCVDKAVQRIRNIIDESISKSKGRSKGKSRLFGQMEPPSAVTTTQPLLSGSFVPQQAPLISVPPTPTPPMQTASYIQEKVFVGLEHVPPSFGVREKILGPGGAFIQHIRSETTASVSLRGRGSGYLEPSSGREAFENLHIYITHHKLEGVLAAKKLCENLIQTIHAEYNKHQSQPIAPANPVIRMVVPPSAAQQSVQHVPASQPSQIVYTVPSSVGVMYPHLQQVAAQPVADQQQVQKTLMVRQVAIPRPVPPPVPLATPESIQQQVHQQQQRIQQQEQQQILNAQLSAAQTVGLIRVPGETPPHSIIQGTPAVLVQHPPPTHPQILPNPQQQIQQQIQHEIQQKNMQGQHIQQQVHHMKHPQQLPQRPPLLPGSHLPQAVPSQVGQPPKRHFREEVPEVAAEDALLGYQHGPPHLTNLGPGRQLVSVAQAIAGPGEPPAPAPLQKGPVGPLVPPQRMPMPGLPSDARILMPPPPLPMMGPPSAPGDIDKHLMPPPSLPPAKGGRLALMDEPPQKRSKGLVSYDGGDSDDDEDIIRSPQAHSHFQPNTG
ncbi:KH homology domain-containing protein 4-like [Patiria miniata]|uniref:KH homology domain-containing protein 4 n=1 Tax=Patiria miniata TaxID=46514 RepID=A0A914BRF1_PATMI|nr:KH homology domain-containing protein 4-like [Patiria miniata]XP_038078740.1 KH homology domain-containing protein 4-like [Patiria miniata]